VSLVFLVLHIFTYDKNFCLLYPFSKLSLVALALGRLKESFLVVCRTELMQKDSIVIQCCDAVGCVEGPVKLSLK